jgi:hypothetical protein
MTILYTRETTCVVNLLWGTWSVIAKTLEVIMLLRKPAYHGSLMTWLIRFQTASHVTASILLGVGRQDYSGSLLVNSNIVGHLHYKVRVCTDKADRNVKTCLDLVKGELLKRVVGFHQGLTSCVS